MAEKNLRHFFTGDQFQLSAVDSLQPGSAIHYSKQEGFIKFHIRLTGKGTTVMDGFGECEFDGPELFILSAPSDMTKVDLRSRAMRKTYVSLCVLRDFFPEQMNTAPEALPDLIRALVLPKETRFALHGGPLTPALGAAARSLLSEPCPPSLAELYYPAKAIELMCLLIGHFRCPTRPAPSSRGRCSRQEVDRLHGVRERLANRLRARETQHSLQFRAPWRCAHRDGGTVHAAGG